jgi:hypothetical protein
VRKPLAIFLIVVFAVILANVLRANAWVARYSVPAAVYITVYPAPFQIEATYTDGTFQGISLGSKLSEAVKQMVARRSCKMALGGEFIDIEVLQNTHSNSLPDDDGEIVLRCKSAGMPWNQILKIESGNVVQLRIAGGVWL